MLDVIEEDDRVAQEKDRVKTNGLLINLRGRTRPFETKSDQKASREGGDSKAKLLSDQDKEEKIDKRV